MILGYLLAMVMGLTLGLIGAGGSILTVPIFVYLLGVKPIMATSYSLLVVGSAALMGAARYWLTSRVNLRAAVMFAIPALISVLATRTYILPNIPNSIAGIPKDTMLMLLFAGLMIISATYMLSPLNVTCDASRRLDVSRAVKLILGSAGVGLLTGMIGAGGGFLIIPTLIALFGLQMKEAIGTSLAIIAINSLVGFTGDLSVGIALDWVMLGVFLALTLLGMWVGTTLATRMEGAKLKQLFGLFTLLIGIGVLAKELYTLLHQ